FEAPDRGGGDDAAAQVRHHRRDGSHARGAGAVRGHQGADPRPSRRRPGAPSLHRTAALEDVHRRTAAVTRLAVALGDPRGIGPEVVAKALSGAPLEADVVAIGADEQVGAIPAIAKRGVGSWGPGTGDRESGRIAADSIRKAVTLALTHEVDAIVTGPVNKAALHAAGVRHPGVTELLGELAGGLESVMMLVAGGLRVVLVT